MTINAQIDPRNATLGEVTTSGDAFAVVFHRYYPKPIEKVWAALTTPERLSDWLAQAEIESRPGGTMRLTWNGQYHMEGRVIAWEPPHTFAWSWPLDDRETIVRFELQADGDGCLLTLTHSGLARNGNGSGVRAGWHAHLDGLPAAIDGRATPWEMKTAREDALDVQYPDLSD